MRKTPPNQATKISANDILKTKFRSDSSIHYVIEDSLNFYSGSTNEGLYFENCYFNKVSFDPYQCPKVTFVNCDFDRIEFHDCSVSDLSFEDCTGDLLYIKLPKVNTLIKLNRNFDKEDGISWFNKIKVLGGIVINIELNGTSFETIDISDLNHHSTLSIFNSPDLQSQEFSNSGKIILNSHFSKVEFHKAFINSIDSNYKSISNIELTDSVIKSFSTHNTNVNHFRTDDSKIDILHLSRGSVGEILMIDADINEFKLFPTSLNNLRIDQFNSLSGRSKVASLYIMALNTTKESNLIIRNCNVDFIQFDTVDNKGLIELVNCKIKFSMKFIDSDLGNLKFKNLNLVDCRLIVINSIITESKFFNVSWNKNRLLYEFEPEVRDCKNSSEKISLYLHPLKEAYRQLKMVSNKELNKTDAIYFEKHELRLLLKIIGLNKYKNWSNYGDYLILATNHKFSDFGESIWKPLGWWSVIHTVLLACLFLQPGVDFGITMEKNPTLWDLDATYKGISLFVNLLSPIHPNIIYDQHIFGLVDFLLRLVASYFLFYFITATRKFHISK